MILLPDEDDAPVGAQVNAVIGEALRQSVADIEPSAAFQARLAAALDALAQAGRAGQAVAGDVEPAAGQNEQAGGTAPGMAQGAGQETKAVEAAS